jgi:ankyrin repeat protein
MVKLRPAYAGLAFLFWLLLPAGATHAQVPPPVSYLFVEVKDTSGKAVSDATVTGVDDSGKEYNGEKTDKEGVLKRTGSWRYSRELVFSGLRVSKPGYLPSDHLIFFRPADGSMRYMPSHSGGLFYAAEDFPDGTWDSPQDSQNSKPPPIRVTLLTPPVTEAERRTVEAEERKRRLLFAVKRGDAATLRTLLAEGVGPDTSDARGVPAIAWAAFTGNRDIIFQLLDAGADVKNKKILAHQSLLIYLSEGMWFEPNRRSADEGRVARREEVVRRLVEAGADVNAQSPYRGVPLVGAISQTPYFGQPPHSLSPAIIKYLIGRGANVNAAGRDGETALMSAAVKGSDEITRMLVAAGANVNAKDKAGKTALIRAPQYHNSNPEVVRVLISAGADVNAADNEGRTALMQAAYVGSAEMVRLLLGAKASVDTKDNKGMTALMLAGGTHRTDVAKALIQAGASVNERDGKGWTALMHAAPRYHNDSGAEFVKVLIEAGADVNTADADGMTPLLLASQWYDAEVIRSLLAAGASINAKDKKGQTALIHAYQNGRPTDVSLFTRAGASLKERDAKGWTALMYAAYRHFPAEEMKALIDAGADVSAVNEEGQTPLMLAAQAGNAGAVKMLLENGMAGAVNASDRRGRTALMYFRQGYTYEEPGGAVVRVLVSAGAEVNATDGEGRTALMSAAEAGSTDSVKALVELGASVNARDRRGRTSLMWSVAAKRPNMHDVVDYLLKAGADATVKDDEGQTALAMARKNGFEWSILSLLEAAEARR